ncbi:MAG: response regulator [Dissulfurispiraceae bacterium]
MTHKLLLADDSLTIQKVIEIILTPENFEIHAFNDGQQALNAMDSFMPDIVLADIEMPHLNGYQLCEMIKKNGTTSHIPVILLAGAFEPFDEAHAREIGADGFIIKPFESRELIDKVKGALQEYASSQELAPARSAAKETPMTVETLIETLSREGSKEPSIVAESDWMDETPVHTEVMDQEPAGVAEELWSHVSPIHESVGAKEDETPTLEKVDEPLLYEKMVESLHLPDREEITQKIMSILDERISHLIKSDVLPDLSSTVKESMNRYVSDVVPVVVEKLSRDLLSEMLGPLRNEIDMLMRRVVPEVAESMIKREIDKIVSGE